MWFLRAPPRLSWFHKAIYSLYFSWTTPLSDPEINYPHDPRFIAHRLAPAFDHLAERAVVLGSGAVVRIVLALVVGFQVEKVAAVSQSKSDNVWI